MNAVNGVLIHELAQHLEASGAIAPGQFHAVLEALNQYWLYQVVIVWDKSDILEIDPDLSDEEVHEVLYRLLHKQGSAGINHDVIETTIDLCKEEGRAARLAEAMQSLAKECEVS